MRAIFIPPQVTPQDKTPGSLHQSLHFSAPTLTSIKSCQEDHTWLLISSQHRPALPLGPVASDREVCVAMAECKYPIRVHLFPMLGGQALTAVLHTYSSHTQILLWHSLMFECPDSFSPSKNIVVRLPCVTFTFSHLADAFLSKATYKGENSQAKSNKKHGVTINTTLHN